MEEKKCILIVEDERAIVEILKFNLKREGYDTLEALDGEAGLELARTEDPDLILLDVMLPKMNGFDICKNLREAGSTVPIIMLTAREEETDKVFGGGRGRLYDKALLYARADGARAGKHPKKKPGLKCQSLRRDASDRGRADHRAVDVLGDKIRRAGGPDAEGIRSSHAPDS